MKKQYLYIFLRFLFLILISHFVTYYFFYNFTETTQIKQVFNGKYEIPQLTVSPSVFLKDISAVVSIPFPFLYFDVYANNNVTATTTDGRATSTLLNIDVLGNYTGNIKTGETRVLLKNISLYNLVNLNITRSFDATGIGTSTLNGDYTISLKQNNKTFIFVWLIIIIPVVYAFFVIFSFCLKFILFGYPFTDLKDFKDKRNERNAKKFE